MAKVLLIFIIIIVSLISIDLFLKEPQIWPDEVIYSQLGAQIVISNKYPVNFVYPPGMLLTTAGLIKIFGQSIIAQRLLSVLASGLFLLAIYYFAKHFYQYRIDIKYQQWFNLLLIGSIILDFTFLKSSRTSRPEIFMLLFGTVALTLLGKAFDHYSGVFKKLFLVILSIICLIISIAFNFLAGYFVLPIAGLFYQSVFRPSKTKFKYILLGLACLAMTMIFVSSRVMLLSQLHSRISVSLSLKSWLITLFTNQPIELQIIYIVYFLATLLAIGQAIIRKETGDIVTALVLMGAWIAAFFGKAFWYFVLPIPFIYLTLAKNVILSINRNQGLPIRKWPKASYFSICLLFCLVLFNLLINIKLLSTEGGESYSYKKYTSEIVNNIPAQSTIFVSAIPDPYYGLINNSKKLTVIEFPPAPVTPESYLFLLNQSDYIILTGFYDTDFNGNFLEKYLKLNQKKITQIGSHNQYQAYLIELVDKNIRQKSEEDIAN